MAGRASGTGNRRNPWRQQPGVSVEERGGGALVPAGFNLSGTGAFVNGSCVQKNTMATPEERDRCLLDGKESVFVVVPPNREIVGDYCGGVVAIPVRRVSPFADCGPVHGARELGLARISGA